LALLALALLALALAAVWVRPALAQEPPVVPDVQEPAEDAPAGDGAKPGAPGQAQSADRNEVVITAEDIEAMKVTKLEDVLNQVPGVSASTSSISIQGSYKVRVFLDGTPLNDPTSSYGAINFDHIPLGTIGKITVMKGSGGLRYGQDATGGVIVIQSKAMGGSKVSGQIRAMAGNHRFIRTDADVTLTSGRFSFGFRGGHEQDRGFKVNNDSRRWTGGFRAGWNHAPGKSVSLNVDQITEESGLSGLPDFPTPNSRMRSANFSASLSAEYGGFSNHLYHNRGSVRYWDRSRGTSSYLLVTELGDSLTWGRPASWGAMSFGAGFVRTEADSSEFGHRAEYTIHVFADLTYRLPFAPLTAKAGLRYNHNSGFQDSLNPEFQLTYSKGVFEASYKISRGANTPTFQQRFNRSSSTDPNPSLGVEKALNQSLGVSVQAHKTLNLHADLFRNELSGRITYVRPVNSGVGTYVNLGKTVYQGVDLGADWKPSPKAEFKGRYSHLMAMDKDIRRFLTSTARNSMSLEALLKPIPGVSAGFKADYVGKTYSDRQNTRHYGGRTLYSLRMEYERAPMAFFLNIENLSDKTYYYVDGLLAPPLTWYAGMRYHF
jgi:iron complex outermembrane receptor protein